MHKYKKSLIFIVTLSLILSSFQFAFADQKLIYEDSQNIKPKTNSFESKEDIKNVTVLDSKLQQSATTSSIGLSDDSADGKYSLKVGVGNDGTANPYYINLMSFRGNDNLVADRFGKIKLFVKPAQNAKDLKFLINDKEVNIFKVGESLKSGQWNEIEINLSAICSGQKINTLKAMVNQGSVWYFDKIELKREKSFSLDLLSSTPLKSVTRKNTIAEQQTISNYGQLVLNNSIENGKISAIEINVDADPSELGIKKICSGIINKIADDKIKVSQDGRYIYFIITEGNNNSSLYLIDTQTENGKKEREIKFDNNNLYENIKSMDISPTGRIARNIEKDFTTWTEVSNSEFYSIGVQKDGTVWVWGRDFKANRKEFQISQIGGLNDIKSVSASNGHFLALKKDGTVWAFGSNYHGELGRETRSDTTWEPVEVPTVSDIVSISAGTNISCALKKDGSVWMWGEIGGNDSIVYPHEIKELKNKKITSLYAIDRFVLAFSTDGFYFVNTSFGGLEPCAKNSLITAPVSISRGWDHLLVLDRQGDVWAIGKNDIGQLGNGMTYSGIDCNKVKELNKVTSIVAANKCSFAIKNGEVWYWGKPIEYGYNAEYKPIKLSGITDVIEMEAGNCYSKFLTKDGTVSYGSDINDCVEIAYCNTKKMDSNYRVDKLQFLSDYSLVLKENQFERERGKETDTGVCRYRLLTIKKETTIDDTIIDTIISEEQYLNYLAMNGNEQRYFSYEKEQEKDDNAYVVSKYGVDRTFGSSGNTITVTHTNTKGEKVTENLAVLKSSINSVNANSKKDLLLVKTKPNTKTTTQNTTKSKTNETSTTTSSSTSTAISVPVPISQNTRVDGTKTDSESTSTTLKTVGSTSPESTTNSSSVQTQEKYDWYAVDVNKKTATILNFDYDNGNITSIKDDGNIAEITYVADGTTFNYRYDRLSGKIVNDESGLENVKFNIYLNTKGPDGGYLKSKITSLKSNVIDIKANRKADTAFVKLQDHKWYMVDAKTKAARELKIDLNDPEIIYVSDDNKLYLYDANSRYMVFDVQTEELKDIRPADAAIDKYLVAEDGRQIIYKSTNDELKVKYLDKITKDAGQYYLLSFDGKCTYQSYKNGRWITVPDSNNLNKESFEKYGMSLSEVNALNSEDFNKLYINDRQIYSVDIAAMVKSGAYYGSQNISQIRCFISEDDMDNKLYGEKTYMAKEENISLDNVRKINGINVVESVNLPTEFIYFMKKGDKYLIYNERDGLHEGDAAIDSLLKDVRKNWIDLKLMSMTKAELINIPSEALTKEFITDATSGAAMKIVYAAKLDDGDTSKYKAAFRLSTTDNYFQSENLKIVIQQNDGKTKEYANLSKVQVEDFMEWVAGRQVNQGPIFYRLKSGNTNEFINYYMIVNVTVQE